MIPDGTYTAVVDRIEDTLVTLQLEDNDLYNLVVGDEELPESARHADAILDVEIQDEELVRADYDEAETEDRRKTAQSRFDRLSERSRRNDEANHTE